MATNTEINELAASLALKADHYASAFTTAAIIVENLLGDTQSGRLCGQRLRAMAQMEKRLNEDLRTDPVGTLEREGLI